MMHMGALQKKNDAYGFLGLLIRENKFYVYRYDIDSSFSLG